MNSKMTPLPRDVSSFVIGGIQGSFEIVGGISQRNEVYITLNLRIAFP